MKRRFGSLWIAGTMLVVALGGAAWWRSLRPGVAPGSTAAAPMRAQPPPVIDEVRAGRPASAPDTDRAPDAPEDTLQAPVPAAGAEADDEAIDEAWTNVDLTAVREALPNNSYWKLGAPTDDPELLQWRADEQARWNVEYGKVLSGTGTEAEIRGYYDHRARVSGDYVEFVTYVLDHHSATVTARDTELLKLARRLHLARLEEIPRKVEEAFERKRKQDAARAAWQADEAAFLADQGHPQ